MIDQAPKCEDCQALGVRHGIAVCKLQSFDTYRAALREDYELRERGRVWITTSFQRSQWGKCGPSGRLFEPRQEKDDE